MPGMNDEELTERLKENFGKCPNCGSSDIDASDYDGGRVLSCKVTCDECGSEWVELYRFEGGVNHEPG